MRDRAALSRFVLRISAVVVGIGLLLLIALVISGSRVFLLLVMHLDRVQLLAIEEQKVNHVALRIDGATLHHAKAGYDHRSKNQDHGESITRESRLTGKLERPLVTFHISPQEPSW